MVSVICWWSLDGSLRRILVAFLCDLLGGLSRGFGGRGRRGGPGGLSNPSRGRFGRRGRCRGEWLVGCMEVSKMEAGFQTTRALFCQGSLFVDATT